MYVQFGCGHCAPEGWINFDASPTLRIERFPVLGRIAVKNANRFPVNVRYGDIVKGLPLPERSVRGLYGSHILEHLPRDDLPTALKNCFRLMADGGIFRLVVPDLMSRAQEYLSLVEQKSPRAADRFMTATDLGRRHNPKGPLERAVRMFGNSAHLWMWDFPSMAEQLRIAGFISIRRCSFNDSKDDKFKLVEDSGRFVYGEFPELAIEASTRS